MTGLMVPYRRCLRIALVAAWLIAVVTPGRVAWGQDLLPGMNTGNATEQPTPSEDTQAPPRQVVPVEFQSPRATMQTFLTAMAEVGSLAADPQAWNLAEQCLDYSGFATELTEDTRRELCKTLKRILDRIELVEPRFIPDKADLADASLDRWVFFPRLQNVRHDMLVAGQQLDDFVIELAPDDRGRWLFSPTTVTALSAAWEKMKDLHVVAGVSGYVTPDEPVEQFIADYVSPTLVDRSLLGVPLWKWIGLFVVILVGLAVDQVTRLVLRFLARRILARQQVLVQEEDQVAQTMRPFGLTAGALVWLFLIPFLGLPAMPEFIVRGAARVFAILTVTWAAWRLADLIAYVALQRAQRTEAKFDDVLVPMVRKAVKIFIVVFAVIYGADSLRIDILPLIASLGIGSVAFAFAAKDTVENFFGSIAVLIDRPFGVGDWIVVGDTEGIVEEIGFRSTRVRTFYNSLITLPNANLVRATVDNYGRRKYRRWKTTVGIQYDTPPDRAVAFCEGIRELVRSHPFTRKDYFQVYLNDFGASSLNILLYVFHEVPDWSTELRERERLFLDIVRLADQLGVQFAFPTQTVHLFHEDASKPHEAGQVPKRATESSAKRQGIRTAQDLTANQSWQTIKPGPVIFRHGPTKLPDDDEEDGDSAIEDRTSGG